jgi:hydrogenase maturation protein HypF
MAEVHAVKAVIEICGVVQGVGFRPYIARLARDFRLLGSVKNVMGHVVIEAFGDEDSLMRFMQAIEARKPEGSNISSLRYHIQLYGEGEEIPAGFVILDSGKEGEGPVMPTPDLAVCSDCLRELYTPGDPRYLNPFISCVSCGPRYTVMRSIPYDRINTSMDEFPMCSLCNAQYNEPDDRRYHAQTVCCNDCGPTLYYSGRDELKQGAAALDMAAEVLLRKEILAIKGIGGYHFACSPFDNDAVQKLRILKGRERKPFAVMFENLASLKEHCYVSPQEEELLTSSARPIVLLQRKHSPISQSVYTTSPYLGAFLPYTPLQQLILRQTGPLIMTSANVTSLPIIKDDDEMLPFFEQHGELGGVLYHNREILRRLDDSVVQVILDRVHMIRRARGYAPLSFPASVGGYPLLALGAQEKASICLYRDGYLYPSQEIGGLDNLETAKVYRETVIDMQSLLHIEPELAVCDMHPEYESTRYAKSLGLKLLMVQHHFAHTAAVMAEHQITDPVIGVSLDGTGYGTDGTVWGGEFLVASKDRFIRAGHMKAIAMLGGDESVLQGWKSAACLKYSAGIPPLGSREQLVYAAIDNKVNVIHSSSMGRVFDGVSAILDICEESQYDGQCAIELENAAVAYINQYGSFAEPFPFELKEEDGQYIADLTCSIREICALREKGQSSGELAYRFHITVSRLIEAMCQKLSERFGIKKIALGGGVFMNRILTENTVPLLERSGFEVYMNHLVSPGDGGLALGQAYIGLYNGKEAANTCASRFPEN